MTPAIGETRERRERDRRFSDELRYWLPIVLSLCISILSLGMVAGRLGGRLDLIEYRLGQIEEHVKAGR